MAAKAEASGSGGGAGSFGSYKGIRYEGIWLMSLTSKAEIRYEGILLDINTKEFVIGLKNVRSFGTEGRKKDGPQISPSDEVYEYILFHGSEIKDLQVKSAPPVQPTPPPIYNNTAIIQSHYSQRASSSTSMPSVGSVTMAAHSSHAVQPGLPRSTLHGGLPLHQTGGSVAAWGSSPAHPSASGSGLALPVNCQWYYGPSGGLPHVQQQRLFRPPAGLPIPLSMQQQMQYPAMSSSPPTGSPNLSEVYSPLLPPVGISSSEGLTLTILPLILASVLAPPLPPEMSSSLMPNKALTSPFPVTTPSWNLPLASLPSTLNTSADQPPGSSKHLTVPGLTLPYQPASQSVSVFGGPSTSSQAATSVPSLVTPHQLIQPGPTTVSSVQPLQTGKDVEAVRPPLLVASASAPAAAEAQAPLLPMPTLSDQKMNGTGLLTDQSNGVHERGRGNEDVEENMDCCHWIYTGACPYLFCKFRHKRWERQEWHRVRASPHKLKPQVDCRVASTWDCCSFVETGSCKYGSQCQFMHREPYLLASSPGKIDTEASAKCKKGWQEFEEICPRDP